MSKEEREAINRCKELIKDTHKEWIGISNQVAIETVLQLIEKQDNRIEEVEKALIEEQLKHTDKINEIKECIEDNLVYVDELVVREQLLGILEE